MQTRLLTPETCPLSPRQALDEATHFRFPCAGDLMHPNLHRFLCTPRDFEGNRHRVHLFMLGASHERAPLANAIARAERARPEGPRHSLPASV